jgi:hypothetical protein
VVVRLPADGEAGGEALPAQRGFHLASRQAYRLSYACQREPVRDRALRRAFKLRGTLGAEGGIGDYVAKPKWMRWRTYDRAMARIDKAEEVVDAHTAFLLDRLKQAGSISKIDLK